MSEKKKSSASVLDVIVYAMMIIAVIYVLVQAILGNSGTLAFKVTLGVWILMAIIIMDYIEPVAGHRFDSVTADSLGWYTAYAITDGAMYMCLYVFVINVSMVKEPVHYIFLAVSIALWFVRLIFFNRYRASVEAAARKDDSVITEIGDIDKLPDDDNAGADDLKEMIYRERNK